MTAEEKNEREAEESAHENPIRTKAQHSHQLPTDIADLIEFLSNNRNIVFKSQQIDDQELRRDEKVQIAKELFEKNRQTFLMRFGGYFEQRHLAAFARSAICDGTAPLTADEHDEEMQFMLKDFERKLKTRKRDVKNRRYAAMQQLIQKGEYFSEQEMMRRAPALYQELIGQYLSEAEKKQRDSYDVRNTTFSGILMHTMEQEHMSDVLKEADIQNRTKELCDNNLTPQNCNSKTKIKFDDHNEDNDSDNADDDADDASSIPVEEVVEVPVACRQQWGNFDNEQIPCSKSTHTKATPNAATAKPARGGKSPMTFITAGERDLLRQEFISAMHEQFLDGKDAEFDYDAVDDNSQLDDLKTINQDEEDAYFESSDDEDGHTIMAKGASPSTANEAEDASDDELDIYMNHLNQHHSLQRLAG